jgi:hypothetical protein
VAGLLGLFTSPIRSLSAERVGGGGVGAAAGSGGPASGYSPYYPVMTGAAAGSGEFAPDYSHYRFGWSAVGHAPSYQVSAGAGGGGSGAEASSPTGFGKGAVGARENGIISPLTGHPKRGSASKRGASGLDGFEKDEVSRNKVATLQRKKNRVNSALDLLNIDEKLHMDVRSSIVDFDQSSSGFSIEANNNSLFNSVLLLAAAECTDKNLADFLGGRDIKTVKAEDLRLMVANKLIQISDSEKEEFKDKLVSVVIISLYQEIMKQRRSKDYSKYGESKGFMDDLHDQIFSGKILEDIPFISGLDHKILFAAYAETIKNNDSPVADVEVEVLKILLNDANIIMSCGPERGEVCALAICRDKDGYYNPILSEDSVVKTKAEQGVFGALLVRGDNSNQVPFTPYLGEGFTGGKGQGCAPSRGGCSR